MNAFNRRFYPFNTFKSLLGIGTENEAPTYAELYSGKWEHPNQVAVVDQRRDQMKGESHTVMVVNRISMLVTKSPH